MDKFLEYCRSELINLRARDWAVKIGVGGESAKVPHFDGMQLLY
jgi:hypothetical protein